MNYLRSWTSLLLRDVYRPIKKPIEWWLKHLCHREAERTLVFRWSTAQSGNSACSLAGRCRGTVHPEPQRALRARPPPRTSGCIGVVRFLAGLATDMA